MDTTKLKDGKRFLVKATATRDQLRSTIMGKLGLFKSLGVATDEEIEAFAQNDPDTIRFMAMSLVHEVSLAAVQNTVDEIESENG